MEVQEVDLAWLAGIIDGEGCFSIFTVNRKDIKGASTSANITVTNSNSLLMNRCKEILDALGIKYAYHDPKNGYQKGRKVMRITIRNYSSITKLIKLILPYLIGKAEQAKNMLEFASLARQIGKLNMQEREVLMNKNKELNRRGHLIA